MTIQSIKTYLYTKATSVATSIKQATPHIIDQLCMENIGTPYLYALRPLAIGLHGYYRTQENGANIAYNALALTGGSFVRSLPPVQYTINVAQGFASRIASFALKVIRSIPLPTPIELIVDGIGKDTADFITDVVEANDPNARLPQGKFMRFVVPLVAGGYLNFRITQFLTRILPYKIASQFTEIKAKASYPNKAETLFWLVSTLWLAFTTVLPRIQRRKDLKEIGLVVRRLVKLEADLAKSPSKIPQFKALEFKRRLLELEGELERLLPMIPSEILSSKTCQELNRRIKALQVQLFSQLRQASKTARPKLPAHRLKYT